MFDIGWSELMVIGVVALIAIGPKELPGVLRTVGQWMGKARRLATEFQGQFQEAMREAEMADLKKSFDEVKEATSGLSTNNMLTKLSSEVTDAMALDKATNIDTPPAEPTTPAQPTAETFVEATQHDAAASEPLAIVREAQGTEPPHLPVVAETHALATPDAAPPDLAHPEPTKDAKAS
ncbi:Sec-independent protein translocase protein TatB [Rhodopseudomonas palustris]|uniref:Sec-independent protein translocase protein TatB n=2 Tax=Rhodopseudomonas palustris (strain ATCC BAA-98 / CGA009) TaxID=258594 RepID=A0AAE9Y3T1_RHOPA|nr:Sec-independent protein translocase protein TatB [Rhodopseudomonas palustris]OPF89929.1 twin arginine-targeting protein translocase TatB [Rhodopseudomonas palustris]PPQ45444.1 twin-arginine translocase subunit TatB [Rhodopseudomonas palustris]RJF65978.1 twin-arginine translocase subunit TatB [Rhodopseudomonas palustris]WAB75766.1 Sec-independent protein translocase protein TatB [Rhodopseudomonas palustris]WCL93015.1 Sec-independent protein translocase protein TatB [Rhodopseudomonas palustri